MAPLAHARAARCAPLSGRQEPRCALGAGKPWGEPDCSQAWSSPWTQKLQLLEVTGMRQAACSAWHCVRSLLKPGAWEPNATGTAEPCRVRSRAAQLLRSPSPSCHVCRSNPGQRLRPRHSARHARHQCRDAWHRPVSRSQTPHCSGPLNPVLLKGGLPGDRCHCPRLLANLRQFKSEQRRVVMMS